MPIETSELRAYHDALGGDTEESRFLRRIPWVIDAGQQPVDWLIRTLRGEADRFAESARPLKFSLLTPLWKTPPRLLDELILSVRCQSYQNWELLLVDDASPTREHLATARAWAARDPRIRVFELDQNRGISGARNFAIAQSSGDFLAVLDHDDLLHPSALGALARPILVDPDVNFLFSNECKITEDSAELGHYLTKPPFDLFTLLRNNYVCHLTAIRRDLLEAAAHEGQIFRPEYDGCEDHDLFLRIGLTGQIRPAHVPLFLYYWRMIPESTSMVAGSKPEIPRRRRRLVDEFTPKLYPGARWKYTEPGPPPQNTSPSVRLTAVDGHDRPTLLVIVPFRDQAEMTLRCLDSLESQQHDLDVRVVLVDNRSADPETAPAIDRWMATPRKLRYHRLFHDGAFNFNRMNNRAVAEFGQDVDLLLFLNNDVTLVSPDALQSLAMHLRAEAGCGFAGIRLMYPDGFDEVQHGGIQVTPEVFGSGYYTLQHGLDQRDFVWDEKVALAVTFACAMTRRATFETLGGLDEIRFPNSFGDVDLCLRAIESGFRNVYFGSLWGDHHESRSRGRIADDLEFANLNERHGATLAAWRLRSLRLTLDYDWRLSVVGPNGRSFVAGGGPLRYVIVDRVNALVKRRLGLLHRTARTLLMFARRRWQAAKRPRAKSTPMIRGQGRQLTPHPGGGPNSPATRKAARPREGIPEARTRG